MIPTRETSIFSLFKSHRSRRTGHMLTTVVGAYINRHTREENENEVYFMSTGEFPFHHIARFDATTGPSPHTRLVVLQNSSA
jgi:hypothetical protein